MEEDIKRVLRSLTRFQLVSFANTDLVGLINFLMLHSVLPHPSQQV